MKKYFGVIYLKNGRTDLSEPKDTPEEAMEVMRDLIKRTNALEKVLATTVIEREMDNFKDGFIFGHPKSRDLLQDKKFVQSLGGQMTK